MARKFRNKIRIKVGGTMNYETGVMTGGVVVGHFVASYSASVSRQTLTSAVSNGPTVQEVDPDSDTCEISVEAEQDSVEVRNLSHYAALGGPAEISSADAIETDILNRYAPFMFGNYNPSGSKEAAKESVTLVGTNRIREAEWIAAQTDLPSGGGG